MQQDTQPPETQQQQQPTSQDQQTGDTQQDQQAQQQQLPTTPPLSSCLKPLINSEQFSDVRLKFRDGSIVFAHKALLHARCEKFKAMFSSNMLESTLQEVSIGYENSTTFMALLEFIYTGDFEMPTENIEELLKIADEYLMDNFKQKCADELGPSLEDTSVCSLLCYAIQYNAPQLEELCLDYIVKNFSNVSVLPSYLELNNYPEILAKITQYLESMKYVNSEGSSKILKFDMENFSSLPDKHFTAPIPYLGIDWRLLVFPKGNDNIQDAMSVYLDIGNKSALPKDFQITCSFSIEIPAIGGDSPVNAHSKWTSIIFSMHKYDWGFTDFINLTALKPFIIDDKLSIVVEIKTQKNQNCRVNYKPIPPPLKQHKATLGASLLSLVNSEQFSDVKIRFLDGSVVFAHNLILKARCEQFNTMVSSGSTGAANSEINMPYENNIAFMAFLKYIYAEIVELPGKNQEELIKICDDYHMQDFRQKCVDLLQATEDNKTANSEGSTVLRFEVDNFTRNTARFYTPSLHFLGIDWRLYIFPNGNDVKDVLSMYLDVFNRFDLNERFSVVCDFAFTLNAPGHVSYAREATHTFTLREPDWGFTRFVFLSVLQKYIINDTLTILVEIKNQKNNNCTRKLPSA